MADEIMTAGSVTSQADRMPPVRRQFRRPVTAPSPNSAPQDTCVVETGMPSTDAPITTPLVIKLASAPWPWDIGVMRHAMVQATRQA